MRITRAQRFTFAVASAVATGVVLAPAAHASDDAFQSPTGGIYCGMGTLGDGTSGVTCEGGRGFVVGKPPGCDHLAWGDRFTLQEGREVVSECHGDTIRPSYSHPGPNPDVATLGYGRSRSAGTITCVSEAVGMTCTDSSTGHYFFMSREANAIG